MEVSCSPSWTALVLITLCHVLRLSHSFKGCGLLPPPLSLPASALVSVAKGDPHSCEFCIAFFESHHAHINRAGITLPILWMKKLRDREIRCLVLIIWLLKGQVRIRI